MKRFLITTSLCLTLLLSLAAQNKQGLRGTSLMDSIHKVIQPIKVLGYGGGNNKTWSAFYRTDMMDGGIVRDRYSNKTHYFNTANAAVDGMNIEHIWANSWWGHIQNFAYKDLFNLYPSDASANQSKSNSPIGIVSGTVSFDNGVIKVGKGTDPGNNTTQTLWEPADNWKGDFARTYFYMATTYSNFSTEGLWTTEEGLRTIDPSSSLVMRTGVYKLMLEWSRQDPVDDIERNRCDSIEWIQGNRNPYVDIPGLCEYIWGDSTGYAFDMQRILDCKNPNIHITPDSDPSETIQFTVTPSTTKLTALPGKPSATIPVSVYMHNVDKPQCTASIDDPFQVSLDGENWKQEITTSSATQPFYLRFKGTDTAGLYESELTCSAPGASQNVIALTCDVDSKYSFFEDFEVGSKGAYTTSSVTCKAATWNMTNALIASTDENKNDGKSVRMKSPSTVTMLTDKEGGCGKISFYSGLYNNDTGLKLKVEYSTNGGTTWKTVVSGLSVGSWQKREYTINASGTVRLRFTCSGSSGKRINLDDILMTNYPDDTGIKSLHGNNTRNTCYDLNGREIPQNRKGLVIVSGKKIIR